MRYSLLKLMYSQTTLDSALSPLCTLCLCARPSPTPIPPQGDATTVTGRRAPVGREHAAALAPGSTARPE